MRLDHGGQGNIIDYSPRLHTIGKGLLPKRGKKNQVVLPKDEVRQAKTTNVSQN